MNVKWRLEAPQLVLLGLMIVASAVAWPFAADRVPIHWNIRGEVDGYGTKATGLLLSPVLAVGFYLLLRFLPRIDPGRANFENFVKAWGAIRLAFIAFLAALHVVLVLAATGRPVRVNTVMPILAALLFFVIGNYMGKLRPNWTVGVRTPWTLSSRLAWTKTHRLAGWLFIGMGGCTALLALVQTLWMFVVVGTVCVAAIAWIIAYSYFVWRSDPNRIPPAGVSPSSDKDADEPS